MTFSQLRKKRNEKCGAWQDEVNRSPVSEVDFTFNFDLPCAVQEIIHLEDLEALEEDILSVPKGDRRDKVTQNKNYQDASGVTKNKKRKKNQKKVLSLARDYVGENAAAVAEETTRRAKKIDVENAAAKGSNVTGKKCSRDVIRNKEIVEDLCTQSTSSHYKDNLKLNSEVTSANCISCNNGSGGADKNYSKLPSPVPINNEGYDAKTFGSASPTKEKNTIYNTDHIDGVSSSPEVKSPKPTKKSMFTFNFEIFPESEESANDRQLLKTQQNSVAGAQAPLISKSKKRRIRKKEKKARSIVEQNDTCVTSSTSNEKNDVFEQPLSQLSFKTTEVSPPTERNNSCVDDERSNMSQKNDGNNEKYEQVDSKSEIFVSQEEERGSKANHEQRMDKTKAVNDFVKNNCFNYDKKDRDLSNHSETPESRKTCVVPQGCNFRRNQQQHGILIRQSDNVSSSKDLPQQRLRFDAFAKPKGFVKKKSTRVYRSSKILSRKDDFDEHNTEVQRNRFFRSNQSNGNGLLLRSYNDIFEFNFCPQPDNRKETTCLNKGNASGTEIVTIMPQSSKQKQTGGYQRTYGFASNAGNDTDEIITVVSNRNKPDMECKKQPTTVESIPSSRTAVISEGSGNTAYAIKKSGDETQRSSGSDKSIPPRKNKNREVLASQRRNEVDSFFANRKERMRPVNANTNTNSKNTRASKLITKQTFCFKPLTKPVAVVNRESIVLHRLNKLKREMSTKEDAGVSNQDARTISAHFKARNHTRFSFESSLFENTTTESRYTNKHISFGSSKNAALLLKRNNKSTSALLSNTRYRSSVNDIKKKGKIKKSAFTFNSSDKGRGIVNKNSMARHRQKKKKRKTKADVDWSKIPVGSPTNNIYHMNKAGVEDGFNNAFSFGFDLSLS